MSEAKHQNELIEHSSLQLLRTIKQSKQKKYSNFFKSGGNILDHSASKALK